MTAKMISLYETGMTQREVGNALGVSQKVVFGRLRKAGYKCRKAAKRFQNGSANAFWKGSNAGYQAFHRRMESTRGRPRLCEVCGTTKPQFFDWANLTGRYDDPLDFKRMCRSCHRNYDNSRRNGVMPNA